jgi:hypothetical protein
MKPETPVRNNSLNMTIKRRISTKQDSSFRNQKKTTPMRKQVSLRPSLSPILDPMGELNKK